MEVSERIHTAMLLLSQLLQPKGGFKTHKWYICNVVMFPRAMRGARHAYLPIAVALAADCDVQSVPAILTAQTGDTGEMVQGMCAVVLRP